MAEDTDHSGPTSFCLTAPWPALWSSNTQLAIILGGALTKKEEQDKMSFPKSH